MFARWFERFLTWPSWMKMLLLVMFTVFSLTITVVGFAWLMEIML